LPYFSYILFMISYISDVAIYAILVFIFILYLILFYVIFWLFDFEKMVDGKQMDLLVHRKGATRSFGPNHPTLPEPYKQCGQPVFIGGTMGYLHLHLHSLRSSLFALRSSLFALRSSLFALRSSLFALRSSLSTLRSSLHS
jgi:tRNA-splicing ligase RtcB